MSRTNTRLATAGAAATMVLAVLPGLLAPETAVAAPRLSASVTVTLTPAQRQQARKELRNALRDARKTERAAIAAANQAFRVADLAFHQQLLADLAVASNREDRRLARVYYRDANLPVRLVHQSALLAARQEYAGTVEAARLAFLTAVGASNDLVAFTNYRQAVVNARVQNRVDTAAAMGVFRIGTRPERTAWHVAQRASTTTAERKAAYDAFRAATTSDRDTLKIALAAAKAGYEARLALAKAELQAAINTI